MQCRVCENNTIELLIDFGMQPIIHHLTEKQDQKYDSYPFRLGYCTTCNFMGIMEYISPEILYTNYVTPSGWKYEPHISTLITTIQNLIGVDPKTTILDIGCNDGKFLEELKTKGYKKLFGVEPAADTYSKAKEKGFEVYNGFFGKQSAENVFSSNFFDLVVTRQVLEHIPDLDNFLEGISYVLKDRGCLVIEVPDNEWNLDYLDYALWEEHVNYFTISSLRSLLRKHSFEVFHYESTLFSGKALSVFCQRIQEPCSSQKINNMHEVNKIVNYKEKWSTYNRLLREFLDSINHPIAVYGCGSRSSNFVNFTGISEMVNSFVDDQPEKQGLYVPGNKLRINSWDQDDYKDFYFLLGVNTESDYKVISKRKLRENQYCSILPPSKNLPEFWNNLIND